MATAEVKEQVVLTMSIEEAQELEIWLVNDPSTKTDDVYNALVNMLDNA